MIPEMISDLDIFRSAQVLIREHGEGTAIEDSQHADAMLEKGDLEGQAVWKRIIEAVEEIQRMEPARRNFSNPSQDSRLLGEHHGITDTKGLVGFTRVYARVDAQPVGIREVIGVCPFGQIGPAVLS